MDDVVTVGITDSVGNLAGAVELGIERERGAERSKDAGMIGSLANGIAGGVIGPSHTADRWLAGCPAWKSWLAKMGFSSIRF
jgi:hypothetical protein